mgnify:CR=1 FL=1
MTFERAVWRVPKAGSLDRLALGREPLAEPGPGEVRVRLHYQGQRLRLFIRDNGCGAQLPQRPGIGLRSIHERARSLGAVLRVHSRPQAGWALCLTLIVPEPEL